MKNRDISEITFHVPPICQGQAVTYAYGIDGEAVDLCQTDYIIRRITAAGEPTQYARFVDSCHEDESSENLEPWNDEPQLGEMTDEWTEGL